MGIVFTTTKNQKDFDQSGPELLKQAIARVACSYLSDYDTVFHQFKFHCFEYSPLFKGRPSDHRNE